MRGDMVVSWTCRHRRHGQTGLAAGELTNAVSVKQWVWWLGEVAKERKEGGGRLFRPPEQLLAGQTTVGAQCVICGREYVAWHGRRVCGLVACSKEWGRQQANRKKVALRERRAQRRQAGGAEGASRCAGCGEGLSEAQVAGGVRICSLRCQDVVRLWQVAGVGEPVPGVSLKARYGRWWYRVRCQRGGCPLEQTFPLTEEGLREAKALVRRHQREARLVMVA